MEFKERLVREIVIWEKTGIISEEQAAAISALYPSDKRQPVGAAMVIFSIIGAFLIGGGIILLFARNWSELPVWLRTAVAFLPLCASWLIALRLTLINSKSMSWREGAGTFNAMSVYACVALIGQIYHLPGDFSGYLLLCSLLILPAAYCLRANVPVLIYTIGVTVWAAGNKDFGFIDFTIVWYILLLALAAPNVWLLCKNNKSKLFSQLFLWCLGICGFAAAVSKLTFSDQFLLVICLYFSTLYLISLICFDIDLPLRLQPLKLIGFWGSMAMLFILNNSHVLFFIEAPFKILPEDAPKLFVSGGLAAICLALAILGAKGKKPAEAAENILIGGVFFFAAFCRVFLTHLVTGLPHTVLPHTVLTNAYIVAVGVLLIVNGLSKMHFSSACSGTVVLSALILIRFFDTWWDFLFRGIAFIVVGTVLLTANVFIAKLVKKGAAANVEKD